jgi:hypothetical protein
MCDPHCRGCACQQLRGDSSGLGHAGDKGSGRQKVRSAHVAAAAAAAAFSAAAVVAADSVAVRAFSWCGMDLVHDLKEGSRWRVTVDV